MATVNLNKMASALCGDNTKVRIRMVGDILELRPTNRVEGKNLPEGEMLVDLKTRTDRGTKRFTLPKNLEFLVSRMYRAEVRPRGWIAMVPMAADDTDYAKFCVKKIGFQPAGASVTKK